MAELKSTNLPMYPAVGGMPARANMKINMHSAVMGALCTRPA